MREYNKVSLTDMVAAKKRSTANVLTSAERMLNGRA
jgi:hypothetical protein